ncbi:hypothetical protein, partial [Kutzneria kofuensis]|uniref:hypothetical protein n=1 Tax=Kutzneria kofuensis TaxID=103725 RepID=UPI0031E786B2
MIQVAAVVLSFLPASNAYVAARRLNRDVGIDGVVLGEEVAQADHREHPGERPRAAARANPAPKDSTCRQATMKADTPLESQKPRRGQVQHEFLAGGVR